MSKVYLKYLLMMLLVVPLLCLGFSVNAQDDCYVSLSSNATTLNCNYQEVIIIASGSDDSMTYEWSNAEISDRIMASASGVYYVTATTTNGCTASASIAITEDFSVPNVSITSLSGSTTLSCSNDMISLIANGEGTYSWSNGSNSSEITVTFPGNYTVTVYGENGCTASSSIDITGSTESPSVYVSGENSLCSGQTAMLTASAMGGMPPYNYIWSDGSNGETANLSAGSYGVTVTDSNGCTASREIVLYEADPIMLSINGSSTICAGESVELTAMAIGGTPDYRYAWSSGEYNPTINVAPTLTTTYIVTATDANGCYAEQDVTIYVSAPLEISLTADSLTSSNPTANIEAVITGGNAPYAFQWSNGSNGNPIQVYEAGTYIVTVVDSNGCSATSSVNVDSEIDNEDPCIGCDPDNIDNPFDPTAGVSCSTITGTEVSPNEGTSSYTHNGSDWDITANDNTGIASITYSLNGGTNTITGSNTTLDGQVFEIGSTTVTWTVYDLYGNFSSCSFIVTVIDNEPPAINGNNLDRELTSSSCNFIVPDFTEEIRAISSDNTTPSSDLVITQTPAAGYVITTSTMVMVTVSDLYGNESSVTINLTIPASPMVALSADNIICSGETGNITTEITSGKPPYSFVWSNGETSQSIGNLSAGTYSLTVTDANGCTAAEYVTIVEPEMLVVSLNASSNTLTCANLEANIEATVSGGTTPYMYTWSNGGTSNSTMANVAGIYSVTATDANGCNANAMVVVDENMVAPMVTINNLSGTEVLTCATTSINVEATSDNAVSYMWSDGVTTASNTFTAVGSYIVTATGANGCTSATAITITGSTEIPTVSLSATDIACHGGTATANVMVNGGIEPYNFMWSDGSNGTTANLYAGSYSVTVTDSNGCTATDYVTIVEPEMIVISLNASSNTLTCANTSANIATTVSGGSAPYMYTWSNGETSNMLTVYTAGTYSVTATDANGCNATAYVSVDEDITVPMVTISNNSGTEALTCATTSINVEATSDNAVSYMWSDGATTAANTLTTVGSYVVTATGSNGCTSAAAITITGSTEIPTLSVSANDIACHGETAMATATVTGGTAPYNFMWSDGSNGTAANLYAGSYSVTVTDSNGCTATDYVTIVEPSMLVISLNASSNTLTCANTSANIATTVSGGSAPYMYTWSNGETSNMLTVYTAGTYSVTATDANGCNANAMVVVDENMVAPMVTINNLSGTEVLTCATTSINVEATSDNAVSYMWSDGVTTASNTFTAVGSYIVTATGTNGCTSATAITITGSTGIPTVSLSATDIACHGGTTTANVMVNGGIEPYNYMWSDGSIGTTANVSAGSYIVTVTDANGCTVTASIEVSEPEALVSTISSTSIACYGANDGSATVTVTGGTAPYTYNWNPMVAQTPEVTGLAAGTYTVNIVDANGCSVDQSISITEPEAIVVSLNAGTISCAEPTTTVNATVMGGTAPYSYMWSDGSTMNTIENAVEGVYFVTVVDANGCSAAANVEIEGVSGIVATVATIQNAQNADMANGAAYIVVNGGMAPYRVALSQEGSATSYEYVYMTNDFEINNLPAATYSLTITDLYGCRADLNFTIENICNVAIEPQITDNGTMLHFENVVYPVTVYVDGNTYGTASEDGYMLQNVANGVHNVFVADVNGCFASISVYVANPICASVDISVSVDVTPTTSTTNPNGAAVITAEGGTAPYTFSWSNGIVSDSATDLYQGTYIVDVTDANGCALSVMFIVNYEVTEEEFDELYVTLDYHLEMEQTYTEDGISVVPVAVVYAQAFGGTEPYMYDWQVAGNNNSNYLKMYESGSVCVNVVDAMNNVVSGCIYVDVPETEEVSNEIVEEVSQAVDSCFDANFVKAQVLDYEIDTTNNSCVVTWELFDVNGVVHNFDIAYPLDSAISGMYAFNLYFTCNNGRLVTSFSVRLYIEVDNDGPVSIEEIVATSSTAYPNPFTDIINLEIESAVNEDIEISVVNISGQLIYTSVNPISTGNNRFEINARDYVPGVYFVRIKGDSINEVVKMVK